MFQGMEYVYEVYKERSFSKAAANLFISQPSLSANVKRIEKKIGYPIFDRSTKPLGLTECGQHYIDAVEHIMQVENGFHDFVNDWSNLKTGQLILGGSSFFSSWVLPPLIGEFSRKYPLVRSLLLEENTATLAQYLQSGRMDFLLDNCELDSSIFDRYVYQKEHLLLAVPESLPVNESLRAYQVPTSSIKNRTFLKMNIPAVSLQAFTNETFIFMKQENDTGKRAARICQEHHFHPRVLFELDQQMLEIKDEIKDAQKLFEVKSDIISSIMNNILTLISLGKVAEAARYEVLLNRLIEEGEVWELNNLLDITKKDLERYKDN